jgi:hypothetical protein
MAEQVIAIQKFRCGAVHGENMTHHSAAAIIMAVISLFIFIPVVG